MDSVAQRLSAVGAGAALELRGVTRLFGALAALTDITLTVRPGERRAVLGSNGAGKTTLFNCITGDFPPTSGTIRFFGEDVTHFPPYERIRRGLRRTYQISALFPGLAVIDNVDPRLPRRFARPLFADPPPSRRCAPPIRPRPGPGGPLTAAQNQKVSELAYGQQRQLEIALALAGAPASFCSTSRPPACRRPRGRNSWKSSAPCPPISAISSSSTTWTSRCASSKA